MPTFQARQLCPKGIFLSPNMEKYAQVSQQIHSVFLEFTSEVEPIAFDEAYLDVTGSFSLYGSPLELGTELKRRVWQETGEAVETARAASGRSVELRAQRDSSSPAAGPNRTTTQSEALLSPGGTKVSTSSPAKSSTRR